MKTNAPSQSTTPPVRARYQRLITRCLRLAAICTLFLCGSVRADSPPVSGTFSGITLSGTDSQQIAFTGSSGQPASSIVYGPSTGLTGFVLGGATGSWSWALNSGNTPLMDLDPSGLALYSSILTGTSLPVVFLSSTGETTYFANSVALNGANNLMPNQELRGAASVLTQRLGDQRYLQKGNSVTVTGSVANGGYLALGDNSFAGNYGFALGYNSYSNGSFASAIGCSATAAGYLSTAIGPFTSAIGQYSTCLSSSGTATGDYSFAAGQECNATGAASVAMGCGSNAGGNNSVVIGIAGKAPGSAAVSLGAGNHANGTASFAAGWATQANGDFSTSFGKDTSTLGSAAFVTGSAAWANGNVSFVAGENASTYAEASFAAGDTACAWGTTSMATGANTTALGNFSQAFGYSTTAETMGHTVIGQFNKLYHSHSTGDVVPGRSQWLPEDELFTIGNGTKDANGDVHPSSAFVVKKSGDTTVYGSLTVSGTNNAVLINPQGDLSMGSFKNGPAPQ